MSELDDLYVYKGVWVNQKDGPIMGRTITTDTRTSTIIVALLAVMSSIGATHLYNILIFSFHQSRASGRPQDALFKQQQALFRTLQPPGAHTTDMIKLWWHWRHKEGRILLRCFIPAILSLLFVAGTLSASIFSSAIVESSGIDVLVDSPYCGFRDFNHTFFSPGKHGTDYIATYELYGENWATDCYKPSGSPPSGCKDVFTQPRIPFTVQDAECPFSAHMCAIRDPPAIVMDSGLLDVGKSFGFNLAPKHGVKFRRRTTCTVLQPNGYLRTLNASEVPEELANSLLERPRINFPSEQFEVSLYGGFVEAGGEYIANASSGLQDATALRSLLYLNTLAGYKPWGQISSKFVLEILCPKVGCWIAIPDIVRTDADTMIMMVSLGNVAYKKPVDDPLFAAHQVWNTSEDKFYLSDHHSGTLGCAVQYQVCISRSGKENACTPLGPLSKTYWQNEFTEASDIQNFILKLIGDTSTWMDFSNVLTLNATYIMNRGKKDDMPDDQWRIEAVFQESKVWAVLQILFTHYAIGAQTTEPHASEYIASPVTPAEKSVCHGMKMKKSGGFANINVLGLALILGLSCTFAIADLLVLRNLVYIPWIRRRLAPRIERWVQDGVLQFQRRAYEAHNIGDWQRLDQSIPTTTNMEKLSELPIASCPRSISVDSEQPSKLPVEQISNVSSSEPEQEVPLEEHATQDGKTATPIGQKEREPSLALTESERPQQTV